jgi:hypothetical protein
MDSSGMENLEAYEKDEKKMERKRRQLMRELGGVPWKLLVLGIVFPMSYSSTLHFVLASCASVIRALALFRPRLWTSAAIF